MAHDVFISYSSKDKPTADAVCATLESRGIRCWIAPRDVVPGEEYAAALVNAIHESRLLVLVFSAGANQSPQVLREVERAVSRALPIIPLRIENVPPSAAMEYYISSRHWLDALTTPLEQHLVQLADTLKLLLSRMPDSFTPPVPVRAVKPVPPVAVEEPLAPPSLPLAPPEARSPQPAAAAPSAEPVLSSIDAEPTPSPSPIASSGTENTAPSRQHRGRAIERQTATVPIVLAGVLAIAAIAFIANAIYKSEKAAAAQQAAEQAAKEGAEQTAHDGMMTALFNKYGVKPKTPQNAGTNATDPHKGSDTSTAGKAPSNPSVPRGTASSPQSTVPPIDPNDDPIGPGGFITPHETEMVQKEVQVCVPGNLVAHESWDNAPAGGKMEAFKNATIKVILPETRRGFDSGTQFRILDVFDSFDPATPDAHQLVTAWHVSGTHTCPADMNETTLRINP